jgi:hypothetical protein
MHFANVETIFRSSCDIVELAIKEVGTCETSQYIPLPDLQNTSIIFLLPAICLQWIVSITPMHIKSSNTRKSFWERIIKYPQKYFSNHSFTVHIANREVPAVVDPSIPTHGQPGPKIYS